MPRKTSHEVVEASFNEADYKLISRYERAHDKLSFVCPNGHEHSITWVNWKNGTRCGKCPSPNIISHAIVEASFNEAGYQLKSQYRGNKEKLSFICPNGHEHSMTWNSWTDGIRCGKCPNPKLIPHAIVEASFNEAGYQLKSQYEGSRKKLFFICPNGHEHSIGWNTWKNGIRCSKCPNRQRTPQSIVEASFKEAGYQLKSQYERNKKKLSFVCPNGHEHTIRWSDWKKGVRCGKCPSPRLLTEEEKKIAARKDCISSSVNEALKRQKIRKTFSASVFANRIASAIYEHLGDRPENHHLDHIIPKCFFDHRNQHEIEACWDINNLQWLTATENFKKSKKLDPKDIAKFSEEQLDILRIASRKPRSLEKHIPKKKMYAEQLKLFA